jgi:hypothetical protein
MRCAAATIPGRHAGTESAIVTAWGGAFALSVLSALSANPAASGPWPREDGAVFLSATLSAEEPRASVVAGRFDTDPSLSVYGELGLGRGFTAGLELDWGSSSRMGTVFARYTLTSSSAPLQLAVDGGFAMRSVDDRPTETLLRVGGSLGGSFGGATAPGDRGPLFSGGGWTAIDGAAFLDDGGSLSNWRAEATLGLHLDEDLRAILALKAEDWPGSTLAVTARPSLVLGLSDGTSLQAGLIAGLRGSDALGLSVSLWQEF